MNAFPDDVWNGLARSNDANVVGLREAHWGFTVFDAQPRLDIGEMLAKATGVGMAVAACLLILPLVLAQTGMNWTHISLLVAFLAAGTAVFIYANRGFRSALQVDPVRAEFRLGKINAKGNFSLRQSFPVSSIESIFLVRSKTGNAPAKLHLRPKGSTQGVFVIQASERELIPVLERITQKIRAEKGQRKPRIRTTRRIVHASFS